MLIAQESHLESVVNCLYIALLGGSCHSTSKIFKVFSSKYFTDTLEYFNCFKYFICTHKNITSVADFNDILVDLWLSNPDFW